MSNITSIGIANPLYRFSQETIARFMIRAMDLNEGDARKLQVLYRATGIETRYSVLPDYGRENDHDFFPKNELLAPFPSTKRRLELFRTHALELSITSVHHALEKVPSLRKSEITHLIVVSCTGMYAPGLDIDLVKALGLNTAIHRTCINFM